MSYLTEALNKLDMMNEARAFVASKNVNLKYYPEELKAILAQIDKNQMGYNGYMGVLFADSTLDSINDVLDLRTLIPVADFTSEYLDVEKVGQELMLWFAIKDTNNRQKGSKKMTMKEFMDSSDIALLSNNDKGFSKLVELYEKAKENVAEAIEKNNLKKLSAQERNARKGASYIPEDSARLFDWKSFPESYKQKCLDWFAENLTNVTVSCNDNFIGSVMAAFPHSKMIQAGPNSESSSGFNSYPEFQTKRNVQIVLTMKNIDTCPIPEIKNPTLNPMAVSNEYSDAGFANILYQNKLWKKAGQSDWID